MHLAGYFAPQSDEELLEVFHHRAKDTLLIAGGTDLIPRISSREISPGLLIDPCRLGWDSIEQMEDGVFLGACLTHTQIIQSAELRVLYPALVQACKEVGGPPVRNRGTIGGNLANASPAADTAPPLLILDALITAQSSRGMRRIPLADFFAGPGRTILEPDEVIRGVYVPHIPEKTSSVFLKLGRRNAMAISVVSVAVRISLQEAGRILDCRIALGSVAPTPLRIFEAENVLLGGLNDGAVWEASELVRKAVQPISDERASAEYRRRISEVLVRRALKIAQSQLGRGDIYG